MQNLSAAWLYPIILLAGSLQAFGPPMNGALQKSLSNPWLSSFVSFLPIVAVLSVVMLCIPRPLPSAANLSQMPWWAPLGGLIGSFAVIVGLIFVQKVGAGVLAGLTITANILTSMAIDQFGGFGLEVHALNTGRVVGALLLVVGIVLVSRF